MTSARTLAPLALTLALIPLAAAGAEPNEGDKAEILALEDQIRAASIKGDAETLGRLWADGYIRTNSRGQVSTRDEALEDIRSGDLKYKSLEYSDVRVQFYNDGRTAIVNSKAAVTRTEDAPDLNGEFRHTRIWVKGPDGWRVAAFHSSRVEDDDV